MANSDLLTFLNIIIKAGLKCKDFKQIGRLPKFFFPKDARAVEDEPLQMWPGYETATRLLNDGIFLNVDTATKFINTRSIYDEIKDY